MSLIKSISGIRGTIGGKQGLNLTPIDVVKFTAAFGTWLLKNATLKTNKIIIGRDARPSGESFSLLISATLQNLGLDVLDLGLSTTPTVEMAVVMEEALGGIIITASHNTAQWNALKLLNEKGEFISAKNGEEILKLSENQELEFCEVKKLGKYKQDDTYLAKHIQKIIELPLVDVNLIRSKEFKIIVDGINSSGTIAIPMLLEALGVKEIKCINGTTDGNFAHNPEPLPENLGQIIQAIEKERYHLGIVVDPDVDRLCFISDDGVPFGEEYTLVAVADYVLKNTKKNTKITVSNLSSSRALKDITEKAGGKYYASAVGEVNVVELMKAKKAVIGGEGNGGIIYPELHYGRDALVGIALFLTHLSQFGRSSSVLRQQYPDYFISKNKIELQSNTNMDVIFDQIRQKYKKYSLTEIDGLRIDFDNQWVHLRQSNTEPIIRIYSEAESQQTAIHLAEKIITDIKEVI